MHVRTSVMAHGTNLKAVTEGPLPIQVLAAIDDAALKAQPKWPPFAVHLC